MIFEEITNIPSVSDICKKYELFAKKSLGQNFLFDMNITRRIVRLAYENGKIDFEKDTIFEIGCGPGGLTRAILEAGAKKLIIIEQDERFVEIISDTLKDFKDRFEVISGDALKTDISLLGTSPRHIIANLPYNISTALLIKWLENITSFSSMTLMYQKEVGDRICASVDENAYGRLAVMANWLCNTKVLFDINPRAFTPPPKVTSSVVFLKPKADAFQVSFKAMEKVVAAAFNQRRKMLRSSLKTLGQTEELLAQAAIDGTKRAEQLDISDFCRLAKVFENK
ncbi:MAG: 16S rRNA (adenine(1518)-N(6)/adenine(1519)-N(6))-dimethyltransferase RsmA [Alphaproteobacteria bacterium]